MTARDELVHERTRVANRLHTDRLVLAPGYGTRIPNLVAARHLAAAHRLLARSAEVRADLARARLGRLRAIDREIAALDARIGPLVQATGASLATLPGVGSSWRQSCWARPAMCVASALRLPSRLSPVRLPSQPPPVRCNATG